MESQLILYACVGFQSEYATGHSYSSSVLNRLSTYGYCVHEDVCTRLGGCLQSSGGISDAPYCESRLCESVFFICLSLPPGSFAGLTIPCARTEASKGTRFPSRSLAGLAGAFQPSIVPSIQRCQQLSVSCADALHR